MRWLRKVVYGGSEPPPPINSRSKETTMPTEEELWPRNQARQENAQTASAVELLTSILEQVKRQQLEVKVTPQLDGEAETAVQIFQEIDAALSVAPVNGDVTAGTRSGRK
jgi:hypothetical protein